jgi:hypothetical protein
MTRRLHERLTESAAQVRAAAPDIEALVRRGRRRRMVRTVATVVVVACLVVGVGVPLAALSGLGRTKPAPAEPTPAPSDSYTDPAGWRVHVPPGWSVRPFSLASSSDPVEGAVISNVPLPDPVVGPPYQAGGLHFPGDGIALVIASKASWEDPGNLPSPPLSRGLFLEGSGIGLTMDFLKFQGNNSVFTATLKTADGVPPADQRAMSGVVSSITFPSTPP